MRLQLLRAIQEHHGEDTPRLELADFLEESGGTMECGRCGGGGSHKEPNVSRERKSKVITYTGNHPVPVAVVECRTCHGTGRVPGPDAAWAELIRVQCRVQPVPNPVLAICSWQRFVMGDWCGGDTSWIRGFIDTLTTTSAALLEHAPRHAGQLAVVRGVTLTDLRPSSGYWFAGDVEPVGEPDNVPAPLWPHLVRQSREAGCPEVGRGGRVLAGIDPRSADDKADELMRLAAAAWCRSLTPGEQP